MKKTRRCAFCGREFTANSGMQKYCSVSCADEAKKERKKRNDDFLKTAEPVIGLRQQEYLHLFQGGNPYGLLAPVHL